MSNPKCDTISDTEEARNLKLISNILTEEAIVGPYSRKVWEHFVQSPFLERGLRASMEQAAALFNPVRCATPISIARLDQQFIIDKGLDPCAVCLDEFLVGSRVTRMPCSHLFHSRCIRNWLITNHVCPLCRFQLPSQRGYVKKIQPSSN